MSGFHLDHLPEVRAAIAAAAACDTIAELRAAILAFDAHPLAASTPAVPGHAGTRCPARNPTIVLGKSPAANETERGIPFQGVAAQVLRQGFADAGLDFESTWWTSVTYWRPRKENTPNATQIAFSRPFIHREIELLQPRLIIALGQFAAQSLFPDLPGITETAGEEHLFRTDRTASPVPVRLSRNHGYVLRFPRDMDAFTANLRDAADRHTGSIADLPRIAA